MKEHVWVESRGGKRLSAMLHLPSGAAYPSVVILCHGFTGEKVGGNQFLLHLANDLEAAGHAVVRFDFAGSGESEGSFGTDTTISGWGEDLRHVIRWVKEQPTLQELPLFLLGHSLGGCVILLHDEADGQIAGRIALAPVIFPEENFREIILGPTLWEASAAGETISHFYGKGFFLEPSFVRDILDCKLDPMEASKSYAEPVLVVHGSEDTAVPGPDSRQWFDSYPGPKEYHLIDGADHSFSRHVPQVQRKIRKWLADRID